MRVNCTYGISLQGLLFLFLLHLDCCRNSRWRVWRCEVKGNLNFRRSLWRHLLVREAVAGSREWVGRIFQSVCVRPYIPTKNGKARKHGRRREKKEREKTAAARLVNGPARKSLARNGGIRRESVRSNTLRLRNNGVSEKISGRAEKWCGFSFVASKVSRVHISRRLIAADFYLLQKCKVARAGVRAWLMIIGSPIFRVWRTVAAIAAARVTRA